VTRSLGAAVLAGFTLLTGVACDFPTNTSSSKAGQPSVASYTPRRFMIDVGGGAITSEPGAAVASSFFKDAKTLPVLGRALIDADYVPEAVPVVVLSHGLWKQRFESSPSIIGQELVIDDRRMTVVGIMPESFAFPEGARLWVKR